MEPAIQLKAYKDKNILITGGLGFIGSNLAHYLNSLGAKITILDHHSLNLPKKMLRIKEVEEDIEIIIGDLGDKILLKEIITGKDIIFDFAGKINHIDSQMTPNEDLVMNCGIHLTLLETCREFNPLVKIIFSSSQLVLGKIIENPITESHPTNPIGFYGIHKLITENYCLMYFNSYGMNTTVLRFTNPYGQRQQNETNRHSLPGWFMRTAIEGGTLQIHGDGTQLRDYIYIDDVIRACALAGINKDTNGQIYNCGYGTSVQFKEMAETIVRIVGKGKIEYIPRPNNFKKEEIGSIQFDISKLENTINWKPETSLEDGIKKMYHFAKQSENI